MFVEIENGEIKNRTVLANPGHEMGSIPKFINEHKANTIICGGMGHRAKNIFEQYQITPILGIQGQIEDIIDQYIKNSLMAKDSLCSPGLGKDYGVPRSDHDKSHEHHN